MSTTSFFRRNIFVGAVEVLGRVPLIFAAGYIARSSGPTLYGTWALVLVFQQVIVSLASLGTSSALSRMASVATNALALGYLRYTIRVTALTFAALAGSILVLRPVVATLFGIPQSLGWLLVGGLLLAGAGLAEGALDAYFKARGLLRNQALLVFTRTAVEVLVIAIVFRVRPLESVETKDLLLIYAAAVVGLKAVIYPLLAPRGPSERIGRVERRRFLRYGLPMIPAALAIWLTVQGDSLLLGHLVDHDELGRYALGATLALYMSYLGLVVYPLLLPEASILFDGDEREGLSHLFRDSQRVFVGLLVSAMCVIALFGAELIELTAGSAYADSRDVLLVLSLAVGFEGLFGIYQWTFHIVKRTTFILWINIAYLVLELVAVVAAERYWGVDAVPWAVLAVVVGINAARYVLAQRLLALPMPIDVLLAAGAVGLLSQVAGRASDGWPVASRAAAVLLVVAASARHVVRRLSTRSTPAPSVTADEARPASGAIDDR